MEGIGSTMEKLLVTLRAEQASLTSLTSPIFPICHSPCSLYVTVSSFVLFFSLSHPIVFPYDAPRFPYISPLNRFFLVEQKAADEFATKHRLQAQGQASAAPAEGAGEGGAAGVLV